MIRKASIMFVDRDKIDEYKRRHDELWPEMEKTLKEHGVHNYSIFVEESTGRLFAYLELDHDHKWDEIANTEVCQKWWKFMAPIMETNKDYSPVSIELNEVFHLG